MNIIFCGFIIDFSLTQVLYKLYLTYYLKDLEERNQKVGNGSILKNISQDVLKAINVPFPNEKVLKQFNDSINSLINLLQTNANQISTLMNLRNSLLPLLINGQVTVKQQVNCDLSND